MHCVNASLIIILVKDSGSNSDNASSLPYVILDLVTTPDEVAKSKELVANLYLRLLQSTFPCIMTCLMPKI